MSGQAHKMHWTLGLALGVRPATQGEWFQIGLTELVPPLLLWANFPHGQTSPMGKLPLWANFSQKHPEFWLFSQRQGLRGLAPPES